MQDLSISQKKEEVRMEPAAAASEERDAWGKYVAFVLASSCIAWVHY